MAVRATLCVHTWPIKLKYNFSGQQKETGLQYLPKHSVKSVVSLKQLIEMAP